ncbi:protein phosphatase/bis(5'-nucleosyl)-tetraphosphatase (symmetrical) [Oceanobacillus limi]|uniref:Protein phosphatase/bis(5'-nucleosyl)-tetraphosphatase (Symmetrical) n=1 Tax=Oceanobacillus limi TaxID=930131 RepID=A0A1I0C9P4_9BACI|nr:bis(5'-nucleosyl)-tetraphosphatase PrpE [Oceanobacillus limi]SET15830.1 protein phosphatase/bis(5'-nucleosyl)-tetraphosphatase (symmetrical) [Oceanobacillus limi]
MKVDIIGDVHGCYDELCNLFMELGYHRQGEVFVHQDGRIPIFVGDITDRGPASIQTIQLVYEMVVNQKIAKYVPGNHCNKLYRFFLGNKVQQKHGLETTVAEYKALDKQLQESVRNQFMNLYENADLYITLPDANVIVAHAGIKESYIGRSDKKVETFVLYGDITGKFDENGKPIRRDWAQHYNGDHWIVYGHTPVKSPRIINKTINIDTGCVFGNALTAFRLPEESTVSVPSTQPYLEEKFRSFS